MAKMLRTEPPSSSVARLLDPAAAARAVQRPSPDRYLQPASPVVQPQSLPDDQPCTQATQPAKREIVLTHEADVALDHLLSLFRRATGTRLSTSHVVRIILIVARNAFDAIDYELSRIGPLSLPSNARDRNAERQAFELTLAKAVARAIRDATIHDSSTRSS